ncbi:uncharacterized protein LOC105699874 [Orussus abietinus]|uniref:uncharacterized protein LOC105699874 n=1 Tax=Orussus abietinus TaxID=222816 RepID=UPI000625BB7A|nr:uncharacterized protein LOC105699874 [Orussus abietinus]
MGGKKKSPKKKLRVIHRRDLVENSSKDPSTFENDITPQELSLEKKKLNCPMGILSRINYPFVECFQRENFPDSDEEDSIELNFRPRFIFVANMCAVCMEICTSGIICEFCKMVSYCSQKHKEQNRPVHEDLCKILGEICLTNEGWLLAQGLPAEHFRIFRVELLKMIEQGIGRPLQLWEKEIILYPRVCTKCNYFGEDLNFCKNCEIQFHCEEHGNDHLGYCQEFQMFRKILLLQHRHGCIDIDIPNKILDKDCSTLADSFDDLIAKLYDFSGYYTKMDCYTYATLSHIGTVPLTALFAMQKSSEDWSEQISWTIHVVGAEFLFEGMHLHVWEKFFLHFLPNLKHLEIVLAGPELHVPQGIPTNLIEKVRICSRCKSASRKINISLKVNKLYHEYSRLQDFIKPDMICLFNPGLYRDTGFNGLDTWPDTIREFCKFKVPVVVTSYTEFEIPRDIERIKSISSVDVILEPQRNPFASLKPDRNFVSDDSAPLMYKNQYISIIKGIS